MTKQNFDDFDYIVYFASKSLIDFEDVCRAIKEKFRLPDFALDGESETDIFGCSFSEEIGFNVTHTEEYDVIPTWIENTPQDVNYQVIVTFYNGSKNRFDLGEIQEFLSEALKSQALKFTEWGKSNYRKR